MREDTALEIDEAFNAWRSEYIRQLMIEAAEAHMAGSLRARKLLGVIPQFDLISTNAIRYAREYGALLEEEGATVIRGEKKPWLADMEQEQRQRVNDIIETGLREGKALGVKESEKGTYPKGSVAADLQTYFNDRKSQASTVARDQTMRIMNVSRLNQFNDHGVRQVEVLEGGPDSCPDCQQAHGQIWSVEYAMEHELEHPNCVRTFLPVLGTAAEAPAE